MLLILTPAGEAAANATTTKFVLGAWPQFTDGAYSTCVCNLALTVTVAPSSPRGLTALILLAERHYFEQDEPGTLDISHTLLDPGNPLTHTTNGAYRRSSPAGELLRRYDGLPDVRVLSPTRIAAHGDPHWPYVRFDIALAEPIAPGATAALRFCFTAPGLFAAAGDGLLRFHMRLQSDFPLCQLAPPETYRPRVLPLVNVGRDGVAGGLDVFLYMPLDYDGEDFTVEPIARLLPDYDHLGRRQPTPRLKFCWSGQMLRAGRGTLISLGDRITIDGRFVRRTHAMAQNNFNNVTGTIITGSHTGPLLNSSAATLAAGDGRQEALRLLERLREALELEQDGAAGELSELHAEALEQAIRARHLGQARGRLRALGEGVKQLSATALPLLDTIEQIGRIIK